MAEITKTPEEKEIEAREMANMISSMDEKDQVYILGCIQTMKAMREFPIGA